jgi:hypothetical protein
LAADKTGPSNLNLQQKTFDFSPDNVCGYPGAGKRKSERKVCTKGQGKVATSSPEMKSIAQNKNNRKKASQVKKLMIVKGKKEDSDSGDHNIVRIIMDDSDKDSEFMEDLASSLTQDEFEDLERDVTVDDYILL